MKTNVSDQRNAFRAFAMGVFCIQLDAFALNQALLDISLEFAAPSSRLQWVISGYLLAVGICMLGAGRLSDRFGHRRLMTAGLCVFCIASLLCALAPSLSLLIAARTFQGVGGACIMPSGLALLSNVFPAERRSRAIGMAIGLGAIATAIGPFLGGGLTQWFSWRAIFWLNVPITLMAVLCSLRMVARPLPGRSPEPLDAVGLVVISAALAAASLTADRLARTPSGSFVTGCLFLMFIGLLAIFVWREKNTQSSLISVELLRNGRYLALTAAGAVINVATVVHLFVVPLSLQVVWQLPPPKAGLLFLAPAALLAIGGPVAGRVPADKALRVMAVCLGASSALFLASAHMTSLWSYAVMIALCGASLGVANALTLVATQEVVAPHVAGIASGLTKTVMTLAAASGVVWYGQSVELASSGSAAVVFAAQLTSVGLVCAAALASLILWRLLSGARGPSVKEVVKD